MNRHGITAENLLETLPQVLRDDPNMYALAASIADVLAKRQEEVSALSIYARIDALPEDLLDILAFDFKIDWWDANYSLEKKRETLKSCWHVHRILGTKEAVVTAIRDIYDDIELLEWWEYGGEPGYFRVETENTQMVADNLELFLATIDKVKRLSAHLEKVLIKLKSRQRLGVGLANQTYLSITYRMDEPTVDETAIVMMDEDGKILTDEGGKVLIE